MRPYLVLDLSGGPHLVYIFWGSQWPPLAPVPAVCSVPLVVPSLLCGVSSPGTTYPSLSDSSQSPRRNHDAEKINFKNT